jgi:hypothetical protein
VVLDKSGFDFRGGQTMAGYVDNIIDTTSDPVVTFVVTTSTVTGELETV